MNFLVHILQRLQFAILQFYNKTILLIKIKFLKYLIIW